MKRTKKKKVKKEKSRGKKKEKTDESRPTPIFDNTSVELQDPNQCNVWTI